MLLPLLLIPLLLAWNDHFRIAELNRRRKILATIGLILLTCVPILSVIAMIEINQSHGRLSSAAHIEQGIFIMAVLSIPFLCFGRRMTKWLGIASALILPLVALLVDTLY